MPLKNHISSLSLTMALAASGTAFAAQSPLESQTKLNLHPDNASVDVVLAPDQPGTFKFISNFYGVRSTTTQDCAKLENFRIMMINEWLQKAVQASVEDDARTELKAHLNGRVPSVLEGDPEAAIRVYADKVMGATFKAADMCFKPK